MGSPSKPKTPEHETKQAEHAADMAKQGSDIKKGMGTAFRADQRRNSRSLNAAKNSGAQAYVTRRDLENQRLQGSTKVAEGGNIKSIAEGMSQTSAGGKSYSASMNTISTQTRATSALGSALSSLGQDETMRKFVKSNKRTQAVMDAAVGGTMAYGMGVFDGEAPKKLTAKEQTAWNKSQGYDRQNLFGGDPNALSINNIGGVGGKL